ncbi:hypothetical protein KIPE111705_12410 [Kibdelosporangium persicum]|uniref:Abortive phage infection protein n=1 Tax=Kibdelosporangium persicum TaxID=2698649 RepID=A0ABX2F9U3_9PSEU|nr:hypothetical protein [Kibdelosporangium persicum]NRN67983.1 Abortive phage infection protein [Kibdelosporangium persicum]
MSLVHRGINYRIESDYWYTDGADIVRQDLIAIRDELYCNAVNIYGRDVRQLAEAARVALELGLEVWLQPRLPDAAPAEVLAHLGEAAHAAEQLRREHPAIVLNVGCEYSLYTDGIIPGRTAADKGFPLESPRWWALLPLFNRRLNVFLGQAAATARAGFHGRITYASGFWEKVDWTAFDIVGVNYYRHRHNRVGYRAELRRQHRHGKPVVILEFGCGSYVGADDDGPATHGIVDWRTDPPRVRPGFTRDEGTQARYLAELLGIYRDEDVDGAFVFEFVDRTRLHSGRAARDLDMAGYAITKVTQRSGQRWAPKAAFHEIARIYAARPQSEPSRQRDG